MKRLSYIIFAAALLTNGALAMDQWEEAIEIAREEYRPQEKLEFGMQHFAIDPVRGVKVIVKALKDGACSGKPFWNGEWPIGVLLRYYNEQRGSYRTDAEHAAFEKTLEILLDNDPAQDLEKADPIPLKSYEGLTTFLQRAALTTNIKLVKSLLERGTDINNPGPIGKIPLYMVLESCAQKEKAVNKSQFSIINKTDQAVGRVGGRVLSWYTGEVVELPPRIKEHDDAQTFEKEFFALPHCAQSNIYVRPLRTIRLQSDPADFTDCIMPSVYNSFSAHPEIIKIDNKNVRSVRTILLLFKELGAQALAAAGNQEEAVISGGPLQRLGLFPTEICHHIIRDAIDFGQDFLKCKLVPQGANSK